MAGEAPFRPIGAGQSVRVFYHPNPPGTKAGDAIYAAAQGIRTPTSVALAHELIHAWHGLSGTAETRETHTITIAGSPPYQLSREEALTVGLGPYANTRISENAIRAEHRLPRRDYYASPNDFAVIAGLPFRPGHRPTGEELSRQAAPPQAADDWW
jgi:hypothetical protein